MFIIQFSDGSFYRGVLFQNSSIRKLAFKFKSYQSAFEYCISNNFVDFNIISYV